MLQEIKFQDEEGDIASLEDIIFAFPGAWFTIHDHIVSILFDSTKSNLDELLTELNVITDAEISISDYE